MYGSIWSYLCAGGGEAAKGDEFWGISLFCSLFPKQYGLTKIVEMFIPDREKHTELGLYGQFKDLIMILRWAIFLRFFFMHKKGKVWQIKRNPNISKIFIHFVCRVNSRKYFHNWNVASFLLATQKMKHFFFLFCGKGKSNVLETGFSWKNNRNKVISAIKNPLPFEIPRPNGFLRLAEFIFYHITYWATGEKKKKKRILIVNISEKWFRILHLSFEFVDQFSKIIGKLLRIIVL